ncbi:HVA22-like protein b [Raphanus sativus]|nr:HVA22-like protein b [Raphanus sativus]
MENVHLSSNTYHLFFSNSGSPRSSINPNSHSAPSSCHTPVVPPVILHELIQNISGICIFRTHGDDKQWLTYWALYSLIKLFELTFYGLIEWIPVWPYAKLALTCWLVLPGLSSAAYVYENYVRPFLLRPHSVNIWYVLAKKDEDDLPAAAGKFTPVNDSGEPTEKRDLSSSLYILLLSLINQRINLLIVVAKLQVDKSAKYVGHSAFDDTYVY